MSHWATFKQTATNLWVTLRHDILALAVFLNGLLIFKTIYGMSVNLLDIFHIKAFSELDLSLLANAPLFMLGVFLVLNSIGLLFRAKLAWAISIILLFDSANLHPAFLSLAENLVLDFAFLRWCFADTAQRLLPQ